MLEKMHWSTCGPPQDNTLDFTRLARQLELNAKVLMEQMTEHAEKLMGEIKQLKVKHEEV